MPSTTQQFDEVRVFEGIAERTGTTVDRNIVRRKPGFCRSLNELTRKSRRMGDGYYYLASMVWPQTEKTLTLHDTWVPIS